MQNDDLLKEYLRDVADIQPLTKDEERRLFRQLWSLDNQMELVKKQLIESKLPLVVTIAERFSSTGIPMLDLIQEGNTGLMAALDTFRGSSSDDFSAHAAACIENAISKAIAESRSK